MGTRTAAIAALLALGPSVALAAPTETSTEALTLSALVDEALAHNLQIAVSRGQIEQAEALYGYAASLAYPQLSATALVGGPVPEAQTTVVNDLTTLTPASRSNDLNFGQLGVTFRFDATASVPVYTFGKIDQGKQAARHVVRAATHNEKVTQAEVVVNVTKAFWTYQLMESFLASLDEGEQTLKKVLRQIEDLLDAESAQVTENDRLRLKYALSALSVRRTEAAQAKAVVLRALHLLLGWEQSRPLTVASADLADLPDELPDLDRASDDARLQRPELLALRELTEAAAAFSELRRRELYPDIFVGGIFQLARTTNATDQTNPFINDDFNFLTAGIGLGLRVELDVFTKLARIEQAEAEANVRAAQAALAEQAVQLELAKLHLEIEGGYERVRTLQKANRTARGWLTASALAYDIGTGAADELIDAFLAWADSEANLQRTRFDTLLRLTDFARAAGRLLGTLERK